MKTVPVLWRAGNSARSRLFSRLRPPGKAAAARIGRPPISIGYGGFSTVRPSCLEYPPRAAGTPEGCCLQAASGSGSLPIGPCRIKTWAAAKLLFARSAGPDPATKLRVRKTLGPEPSGCLQDRRDAAADRADAVGCGSARRTQAWRRGTASSTPDGGPATCVRCQGRFGDIPHRAPAAACGSGRGVAADTAVASRWSVPGEIGMV